MILGNINDSFKIELPKIFIPDEVKEKYKDYLNKLHYNIVDVTELINFSIQSVTLPSYSQNIIEQPNSGYIRPSVGGNKLHRNSTAVELLSDRTFTITFKLLNGNINYWILLDTFFYYYDFANIIKYSPDLKVRIHDIEGIHMYTILLKDCIPLSISEFTLSYSEMTPEFNSFDLTFNFNKIDLNFETQ